MRATAVVVILLAAAACGSGGGGADGPGGDDAVAIDGAVPDARPDGLGSVDVVPGSCSNGSLPRTQCRLVEVQCTGVAARQAELRISEPPSGTAVLGTVVFGTGGGGTSHYEGDPTAFAMLGMLQTAGYRIVQRQWIGAQGWIGGPGGFPAVSCRYETLLQYVFDDIHGGGATTGAFCATGNSGGSSELAYALAHWDRGSILDLAVPTGGPPMGRLDHGCLDGTDPAWLAECAALVPGGASTCAGGPSCSFSPNAAMLIDSAYGATHCAGADAGFRATFLADSAAAPAARFDYPSTRVHFLFGADDCTEAVPLGLAFAAAVTSEKQIDFIPNTPHAVFSSTAGAMAIRDAITTGCVPR